MSGGLLTFGDSLSLPRPWDRKSPASALECWPHLISSSTHISFHWHWHFGLNGGNARDFLRYTRSLVRHLADTKINAVVVQLGIVDATPRHLPNIIRGGVFEKSIDRLLLALPRAPLLPRLLPLRKRRMLYRLWGKPSTSVKSFEKTMAQIRQSLGALNCPVLVSTIVEPGPKLAALTGTDGVFDYVAAIQRVCALNGGGSFC